MLHSSSLLIPYISVSQKTQNPLPPFPGHRIPYSARSLSTAISGNPSAFWIHSKGGPPEKLRLALIELSPSPALVEKIRSGGNKAENLGRSEVSADLALNCIRLCPHVNYLICVATMMVNTFPGGNALPTCPILNFSFFCLPLLPGPGTAWQNILGKKMTIMLMRNEHQISLLLLFYFPGIYVDLKALSSFDLKTGMTKSGYFHHHVYPSITHLEADFKYL